ncbi:MAG: LysM peptidoglycan-binding domain-containing protein [Chloroflexi bacterium]|nr:MAG: LysM peptidoglycan-binding domain-containing protein [Chloroflexota bacterium]
MSRIRVSRMAVVILGAAVLGVGTLLAVFVLSNRPAGTSGLSAETVTVAGETVLVARDPQKAVRLVGNVGEAPSEQGQPLPPAPEQQPTTLPAPTETPVPTPIPTATPVPEPVVFIDYTVQPNDSLYGIALRPDTSIALMAHYGIDQEDLVPGEVIKLPVGNPAYCPENLQPYAVGEGDTAFSIARQFGITADQLREFNGLDEDYTVYVATIICVPR